MKKMFLMLMVLLMSLLVACGEEGASESTDKPSSDQNENTDQQEENKQDESNNQNEDTNNNNEQNKEEKEQSEQESDDDKGSVKVDKGLTTVKVTLPEPFVSLQNKDVDQIISEAKEEGIKKVIKNDDGSLTYVMSKAKHKEMMDTFKTEITASIQELVNNPEFKSIQDIKVNDSFDEFTMIVNQAAYENSYEYYATISLGLSGSMYQLFDGVSPDDFEVTINIVNADTGEVFDTVIYPEDMKDMVGQ